MNQRFPVLSTVAYMLRIVGWLTVACGIVVIINGFVRGGNSAWWMAGSGLLSSLWGLITVASGEAIDVLFAIEENTRAACGSVAQAFGSTTKPSVEVAVPQEIFASNAGESPVNVQLFNLLRKQTFGKAVTFASIIGNQWTCICGQKNPYDPMERIQNCERCQTNRDYAVKHYSVEAMQSLLNTKT